MSLRVGMPRGLDYYYHGRIWEAFFRELGCEPTVSEPTLPEMIADMESAAEICLPLRTYLAHAGKLANQVDFLFVPRIVSYGEGRFACPKMMGLPDLVRYGPGRRTPLLDIRIDHRRGWFTEERTAVGVGRQLGHSPWKSCQAWWRACEQAALQSGTQGEEDEGIRVALIGHPYLLQDRQASQDIEARLRNMGIAPVLPGSIQETMCRRFASRLERPIYWEHGSLLAGAALALVHSPRPIWGLIFVTSFACGPDSILGELLGRYTRRNDLPFLQLFLDGLATADGMITRLEAFVELVKRSEASWS